MFLIVFTLFLLVLLIIWVNRHSNRINDYFANAVEAYAIRNDEAAKVAAVAAAKVAANKQRQSMIVYLESMAQGLRTELPNEPKLGHAISRILEIKSEIGTRDWSVYEATEEKQRLGVLNPEYLKGLDRADPNVFGTHPQNQYEAR